MVKDAYSVRQISEYLGSLEFDLDNETYEYRRDSNAGCLSGQYSSVLLEKLKVFVVRQCDIARRQLRSFTGIEDKSVIFKPFYTFDLIY